MKRALTILAALVLVGCTNDDPTGIASTGPLSTPTPRTILHGLVVNENGECIPGASVQILIGGQEAGETIEQKTPCTMWDYDHSVGFVLEDVLVGAAVTIRSWAPGHAPQELTVFPTMSPVTEVFLTLSLLASDR